MPSTLSDFGRGSERYGDIAFYYAFPVKFWFGQSMLVPEDVLTWCRENCTGFYKVVCYTHEDSVRRSRSKEFEEKIMYVDKIYLSSEEDAALIKLTFDVRDQQVKRPKLKRTVRRTVKKERVVKASDPAAVAAATRKHAAKAAKVAAKKSRKKAVNPAQLTLI
jgi:hypothetical protein